MEKVGGRPKNGGCLNKQNYPAQIKAITNCNIVDKEEVLHTAHTSHCLRLFGQKAAPCDSHGKNITWKRPWARPDTDLIGGPNAKLCGT